MQDRETNKQILIVDDDSSIRQILEITLKAMTKWAVLTAASGKEALTLCQKQQPDAILLDLMMPGMDGIETLKGLQANPATQSIPVIFLTAKTISKEQQKLNNLAIAGIIAKPFKAPDLVTQMRSHLHWDD